MCVGSSQPRFITDVNGMAFFAADGGTNGTELWMSDGTETGTVLVKDINPGSGGSFPSQLTNLGGTAVFRRHRIRCTGPSSG